MKAFRVEIRLRNNLIRSRREELGLSVRQLREKTGLSIHTLYGFEGLSLSPVQEQPGPIVWTRSAKKLAAFFGCPEEELFPDAVRAVVGSFKSFDVSAGDVRELLASSAAALALPPDSKFDAVERREVIDRALDRLSPRYAHVLRRSFGLGVEEASAEEIGKEIGCSSGRVGEIKNKAMCTLRSLNVRQHLAPFSDS